MMNKYENADVLALGLENNASSGFTVERQEKFNLVIKALAEYFGAIYVDQCGEYSEINAENMVTFGMDAGCTHPNSLGHAAMERMILRVLADEVKKTNV